MPISGGPTAANDAPWAAEASEQKDTLLAVLKSSDEELAAWRTARDMAGSMGARCV